MNRRVTAAGVALSLLVVPAGGCGEGDEPAPVRGPRTVDALRGTYRGIGLGNRPARVRSVFGKPARFDPSAGIAPTDTSLEKIGGPPQIIPPRRDGASSATELLMRYKGVSFLARNNRVYALLVSKDGVQTTDGVGIGSPLSDVEARYGNALCATATEAHGQGDFDYCEVNLAPDRYVLFSKDPIRSIAIATRPMQ
jgi:hypothetical protein